MSAPDNATPSTADAQGHDGRRGFINTLNQPRYMLETPAMAAQRRIRENELLRQKIEREIADDSEWPIELRMHQRSLLKECTE